MVRVGIVMYPGSNGHRDMVRYFDGADEDVVLLWHAESDWVDIDLLVLPGGFAYGDRDYEEATGSYVVAPGLKACKDAVSAVVA